MELECPHCFTLVYPKPDGECPACQQNTRDTRGLDLNRATVVIGEEANLPDICCSCGAPAWRTVRVRASKPVNSEVSADCTPREARRIAAEASRWFGLPGLLVRKMIEWDSPTWHSFEVPVTQCDDCAAGGPPKPLRADHERRTMRFIVHRSFHWKFELLNRIAGETDD